MTETQVTMFEEDYLVRTLGAIATKPETALTELIANAWDAGATRVDVSIPEETGQLLVVEDNGTGLTQAQFHQRWMTLGYNRVAHQGSEVEFPPERQQMKRTAYGRNGVGRHGMLCFCRQYRIETRRGKQSWRFKVGTTKGREPFTLLSEEVGPPGAHGTRLVARVEKNLPSADHIREVLSARFAYDPEFDVYVNGETVPLEQHEGLIHQEVHRSEIAGDVEYLVLDSSRSARNTVQHGVAIWVEQRLVGVPTWSVGNVAVLDGRVRAAKRMTMIVRAKGIGDTVLEDWSGFRGTDKAQQFLSDVRTRTTRILAMILKKRAGETVCETIEARKERLSQLDPGARADAIGFVGELLDEQPLANTDFVNSALDVFLKLEEYRSGQMLLELIGAMSEMEMDDLIRLLSEWTLRDAMTVLDEISKRLRVVEAISKLASDKSTDEVHTLFPLVTQARWIFGPEFDSQDFVANKSLRTALTDICGTPIDPNSLENASRRPDLILYDRSMFSIVGLEGEDDGGLFSFRKVLVIELKRGGSTIGRDEMSQAVDYVEDLLNSGHVDGAPKIEAWVVGHKINRRKASPRKVGEGDRGEVRAATFNQLTRTANKRLFRLRERVDDLYPGNLSQKDIQAIIHESPQMTLL